MQEIWHSGSIPGWERSPGGGHGNPIHYYCLQNPMGRGDWQAIDHGVAKSRTWRKWQHVCVELEELLLLVVIVWNRRKPPILPTLPSATRKTAFSRNRELGTKILWDTVTTNLPVMTYRTNHITQPAQDTLGCECHSKWEWTKVLCKNQCRCCLEGGHSSWTTKSSQ